MGLSVGRRSIAGARRSRRGDGPAPDAPAGGSADDGGVGPAAKQTPPRRVWGGRIGLPLGGVKRAPVSSLPPAQSFAGAPRPLRRDARSLWMARIKRRGPRLAAVVLALGLPVTAWATGWAERQWEAIGEQLVAASAGLGLEVKDIVVIGRGETDTTSIMRSLAVSHGDPIFRLDPSAAREALIGLPWIRSAVVTRRLPDRVIVEIEERRPLALWQRDGRFHVIDTEGVEIPGAQVEQHRHLPLVVGAEAPEHTLALFDMLSREPGLWSRVRAAVRVGGRRWNIRLKADDGDVDVQLPEENASAAWMELARLQHEEQVLSRAVREIDMRLPDRIIMRRADGSAADGKPEPPATDGTRTGTDARPVPAAPATKPPRQTAQGGQG